MAKKKSETRPPGRAPEAGLLPEGYESFLSELKERIRTAQLRASVAVNRELIALYWQIGNGIVEPPEDPPLGQCRARSSRRRPAEGLSRIERILTDEPLPDASLLPRVPRRP